MSDFDNNNITPDDPIPPMQQPEFEVPPQPVQFEQPHFEQPQDYNGNSMNNMPPKKSKKKLVGIIATVVGVAACVCVAVFAGPKIIDALSKRSKAAPLDRFKNAITKVNEEFTTEVKENENYNTTYENKDFTMAIQLELSESTMSMIPEEYAGLANFTANLNAINYSGQQYASLNLSTPAASIGTVEVFGETSSMFLRIPELSDAFLTANYYYSLQGVENPTIDIQPISSEQLVTLLSDEVTTFLDQIKTVELNEDSKLTAGGITASYDKLTTTLTPEEFSNVVYNCFKRLSEDQYFVEVFDVYANLYDSRHTYTVEDSLNELKDWADTNTVSVALDLYLDEEDNIVGFVMRPQEDGSSAELGYITAEDGKKTGFEFFVKDGNEYALKVDGSYTSSKDVYNGTIALTTYLDGEADTTAEITFKDFTCANQKASGILTLTSPEMMGLTLSADINIDKNTGNIKLNAIMTGMDLGSITFDYTLKEATSCPSLPDSALIYDSEDSDDMAEYMGSADLYGFLDNFYTATGIDLTYLMYDIY